MCFDWHFTHENDCLFQSLSDQCTASRPSDSGSVSLLHVYTPRGFTRRGQCWGERFIVEASDSLLDYYINKHCIIGETYGGPRTYMGGSGDNCVKSVFGRLIYNSHPSLKPSAPQASPCTIASRLQNSLDCEVRRVRINFLSRPRNALKYYIKMVILSVAIGLKISEFLQVFMRFPCTIWLSTC